MNNMIRYCVHKSYKGLFIKKHQGNAHFLILSAPNSLIMLNILGKIQETGEKVAQLFYRVDISQEENVIGAMKQGDTFEIVEELPCKIVEEQKTDFSVIIPKKGRYINSNLKVIYKPEYSGANRQLYIIDGELSLGFDENLTPTQLKMKALKTKAKLATFMKQALRSV